MNGYHMTDIDKLWFMKSTLDLIKNKVSVLFSNTNYVYTNDESKDSKCGGFFSEDPLSLSVAVKKSFKKWFLIYIHEYNHYIQFKNKTKKWVQLDKLENLNTFDFDAWMYGNTEYPKEVSDTYIDALQDFELECETMSVHTILENDLSVNVIDYIKQANSYILFYNIVKEERKWCKKAPYNVPRILDMMPDELITDPRNISKEIYIAILKDCL